MYGDPVAAEVVDEAVGELLEWVETKRIETATALDPGQQKMHAQYFTQVEIARLMASMVDPGTRESWRVLDPGAGIGILAAAVVERLCTTDSPVKSIDVTEIERRYITSASVFVGMKCIDDILVAVRYRFGRLKSAKEFLRGRVC